MPSLKNSVLFVEDDNESKPVTFDRDLTSLLQQRDFEGVRGIAIGRFQGASEMTRKLLEKIVRTKKELEGVPVIADLDFGHTPPQMTFPIGGSAEIVAEGSSKPRLKIIRH